MNSNFQYVVAWLHELGQNTVTIGVCGGGGCLPDGEQETEGRI